jgi:lipoyl(octanoyl) transferase
MMFQEETGYRYESYFPALDAEELERQTQLNVSWREKICQWSYNVVDHFDLPREVVAISLDLFDRYLATRGNQCTGNLALLASLTTLHIAIKIHSEKNVKVATLASLSRGQFGPKHIEQMEWQVFSALGWKLHPPTLFAFISHFLMLFPSDVHHTVRKELFEVAIYMAELSVCDSYFVKLPASTIAMAAVLNVMEDMPLHKLSHRSRELFWRDVTLGGFRSTKIQGARDRLKAMFMTTPGAATATTEHSLTSSPTSTTDMQVDETEDPTIDSCNSSYYRPRVRSNSTDSKGSYRYSPSTMQRRNVIALSSPMSCNRSRIVSSPIVAGNQ